MSFEVALRNRIHVSLSRQASQAAGNPSDSFAWYDPQQGWLQLQGETGGKIGRLLNDEAGLRLAVQPSSERVVSALSFGVWTNILDSQLPTPPVELLTFSDVFPHYPAKKPSRYWAFAPNRKSVVERVKDVRVWRNRLSHCKPVWSEGWFRASPTQHWQDMLRRVSARRQEVEEVLGWICPHTAQVCRQSFPGRLFDGMVTENAVFDYLQGHLGATTGPAYPVPDPTGLRNYKART